MLNLSRSILIGLIAVNFVFAAEKIDVNTAPLEDLVKIIHIGEIRARELISLRPFASLDELVKIKGIGEARLRDIKEQGLAWVAPQLQPEPQPEPTIIEEEKPVKKPDIIYPSGIVINEILPSPDGPDETEEWIEIFNKNNFEVNLTGWQITDTAGKTTTYTLPTGTKILALGFLVLNRPETKIVLNNDNDGLNLIQPDGKITDSVSYEKAPQGQSFNRTDSGWLWSENSTPGAVNRDPTPVKTTSVKTLTKGDVEGEKGIKGIEGGLAAVSEPIILKQNNGNFYPFLAAFVLAIFSGFVILFLKKKIKI